MKVDIHDLERGRVLAALYRASRVLVPQLGVEDLGPVTPGMARRFLVENGDHVQYMYGRVIHATIAGDELDSTLYDRDIGEGAMQMVVQSLREFPSHDNPVVDRIHQFGMSHAHAFDHARELLGSCINRLPPHYIGPIGPYHYVGEDTQFLYTLADRIRTLVRFHGEWDAENLEEIGYRGRYLGYPGFWGLMSDQLIFSTVGQVPVQVARWNTDGRLLEGSNLPYAPSQIQYLGVTDDLLQHSYIERFVEEALQHPVQQ